MHRKRSPERQKFEPEPTTERESNWSSKQLTKSRINQQKRANTVQSKIIDTYNEFRMVKKVKFPPAVATQPPKCGAKVPQPLLSDSPPQHTFEQDCREVFNARKKSQQPQATNDKLSNSMRSFKQLMDEKFSGRSRSCSSAGGRGESPSSIHSLQFIKKCGDTKTRVEQILLGATFNRVLQSGRRPNPREIIEAISKSPSPKEGSSHQLRNGGLRTTTSRTVNQEVQSSRLPLLNTIVSVEGPSRGGSSEGGSVGNSSRGGNLINNFDHYESLIENLRIKKEQLKNVQHISSLEEKIRLLEQENQLHKKQLNKLMKQLDKKKHTASHKNPQRHQQHQLYQQQSPQNHHFENQNLAQVRSQQQATLLKPVEEVACRSGKRKQAQNEEDGGEENFPSTISPIKASEKRRRKQSSGSKVKEYPPPLLQCDSQPQLLQLYPQTSKDRDSFFSPNSNSLEGFLQGNFNPSSIQVQHARVPSYQHAQRPSIGGSLHLLVRDTPDFTMQQQQQQQFMSPSGGYYQGGDGMMPQALMRDSLRRQVDQIREESEDQESWPVQRPVGPNPALNLLQYITPEKKDFYSPEVKLLDAQQKLKQRIKQAKQRQKKSLQVHFEQQHQSSNGEHGSESRQGHPRGDQPEDKKSQYSSCQEQEGKLFPSSTGGGGGGGITEAKLRLQSKYKLLMNSIMNGTTPAQLAEKRKTAQDVRRKTELNERVNRLKQILPQVINHQQQPSQNSSQAAKADSENLQIFQGVNALTCCLQRMVLFRIKAHADVRDKLQKVLSSKLLRDAESHKDYAFGRWVKCMKRLRARDNDRRAASKMLFDLMTQKYTMNLTAAFQEISKAVSKSEELMTFQTQKGDEVEISLEEGYQKTPSKQSSQAPSPLPTGQDEVPQKKPVGNQLQSRFQQALGKKLVKQGMVVSIDLSDQVTPSSKSKPQQSAVVRGETGDSKGWRRSSNLSISSSQSIPQQQLSTTPKQAQTTPTNSKQLQKATSKVKAAAALSKNSSISTISASKHPSMGSQQQQLGNTAKIQGSTTQQQPGGSQSQISLKPSSAIGKKRL